MAFFKKMYAGYAVGHGIFQKKELLQNGLLIINKTYLKVSKIWNNILYTLFLFNSKKGSLEYTWFGTILSIFSCKTKEGKQTNI